MVVAIIRLYLPLFDEELFMKILTNIDNLIVNYGFFFFTK